MYAQHAGDGDVKQQLMSVARVSDAGHKVVFQTDGAQHAGDGDAKQQLMSVARVSDAGHEVVFQTDGGFIKHTGSGQITKFDRKDHVYRLKVSVAEPVFSRQRPQ